MCLCLLDLDYVMPCDDPGLENLSSHSGKRLQTLNSLSFEDWPRSTGSASGLGRKS